MENSCNLILNLTTNASEYPKYFKKIYDKNCISKKKIYIAWIDNISKNYKSDIFWWSLSHVSKYNYLNKIYHYFVLLESINHLRGSRNFETLIVDKIIEFNVKKIKFNHKKKIIIENEKKNVNSLYNIFKFALYQLLTILIFKLIPKKNYANYKMVGIDCFITNFSKPDRGLIEKFKINNILKKNFLFIPTLSYMGYLKRFYLNLKLANKKNYLLKEQYLEVRDLFNALKIIKYANSFNNKIQKIKKWDFKNIILFEMKNFSQYESILSSVLNFSLAKNLKKNKINFLKVINYFENQNIDKGWNLGFNTFYGKNINVGYQAFNYLPESFNISPSKLEVQSGVCPKKIIVKGEGFKKLISENCNNIIFSTGPSFQKFNKKNFNVSKKIDYLFLLTGIPIEDQKIINEMQNFKIMNKNKKIAVKFHPISKISSIDIVEMKKINISILEGNIAQHLTKSNFVVTTGLTTSLIEALIYNCKLIICSDSIYDKLFFKKLKISQKSYKFIRKFSKKNNFNLLPLNKIQKNYLIKNFFAEKNEKNIKNLIG